MRQKRIFLQGRKGHLLGKQIAVIRVLLAPAEQIPARVRNRDDINLRRRIRHRLFPRGSHKRPPLRTTRQEENLLLLVEDPIQRVLHIDDLRIHLIKPIRRPVLIRLIYLLAIFLQQMHHLPALRKLLLQQRSERDRNRLTTRKKLCRRLRISRSKHPGKLTVRLLQNPRHLSTLHAHRILSARRRHLLFGKRIAIGIFPDRLFQNRFLITVHRIRMDSAAFIDCHIIPVFQPQHMIILRGNRQIRVLKRHPNHFRKKIFGIFMILFRNPKRHQCHFFRLGGWIHGIDLIR